MNLTELLQFLAAVFGVSAVVCGAAWWCLRRYLRHLWRMIDGANREKASLQDQLEKAAKQIQATKQLSEGLRTRERRLRRRGRKLRAECDRLREEGRDQPDRSREFALINGRLADLTGEVQEAKKARDAYAARARELYEAARKQQEQIHLLRQEKIRLEGESRASESAATTSRQAQAESEEKLAAVNAEFDGLAIEKDQLNEELDRKADELADANRKLIELGLQIRDLEAQLEGSVDQNGRVWERPVAPSAPRFVPLPERKMPIISLINLKGGVGKTTITANLAATLGLHGNRVLVIDLDYQRSLSRLCCSNEQLIRLHQDGRCLQHFLLGPERGALRLLNCADTVRFADKCSIVVNSDAQSGNSVADSLDDAEMNLLARWLVNPTGPDLRMYLREALHAPEVRARFDYVLFDCPPRLSTACINALAASDFALIPVQPDLTSAISAPNLLKKVKRLRGDKVLGNLGILGVVANRVVYYGDQLRKDHLAVWDDLQADCSAVWGQTVYFFETMIGENSEVAIAAARHTDGKATKTFAAYGDDLKPVFTDLANEVLQRIAATEAAGGPNKVRTAAQ
jgi:cellulose biosynthesis protein BcsQ